MKTFLRNMRTINLAALFALAVLAGFGVIGPESLIFAAIPLTVTGVAGHPDYTATGDYKNIPWLWSRKTVVKYYDESVVPQITFTDTDTEIKQMGDKVIFNTIPTVVVRNYRKGQDIDWQIPASDGVEMTVDRASYYAIKFDKVDIKQFALNMMDKTSQDGAEQMKITIDTAFLADVYADAAAANKGTTAGAKSSSYNLGTTTASIPLTKANIVDYIMMCEAVADEQNWPTSKRWMVLPTWAKYLLSISDLKDASMTGESKSRLMTGGRLGRLGDFTLYYSNLYTAVSDTYSCYNITFGHSDAICFVTQLVENEFHEKFENTFGSGMKGLQVYDWKVVHAAGVGVLYARKG